MLYLLFVLTFLAGILFYGLSPHDKGLDMSTHQAEGMIATFLAQHQAARDYLYTWLGADDTNNTGNLQNGTKFLRAEVDVSENPTFPNFETMMPRGVTSDMCKGNNGIPGDSTHPACFVSKVVCTNSARTDAAGCNELDAKHYVITYGGWEACTEAEMNDSNHDECYGTNNVKRPSWWPRPGQKLRRFESWRRAIANRTRGSITCGTLFEHSGNWCIDNGESVYKNESADFPVCMKQVPPAVISALPYSSADNGLADLLFCISEFKQGLGNYVSGATYFYDGLANTDFGQHKSDLSNDITWKNLHGGTDISSVKFPNEKPYTALSGGYSKLDSAISLSGNFTLTILADIKEETGTFPLLANTDGASFFKWQKNWDCGGSKAGFYFKHALDDGVHNATCFTAYNSENPKIVSWTFVVGNCPDDPGYGAGDTCMFVYENAVRRSVHKKDPNLIGNLRIGLEADVAQGANIYGIRYYGTALTPEQIQQNFKVDQKRFGISDVNNGKTDSDIPAIIEEG